MARHLTRTLPPGAVLVASSSMPVRDVEWFGVGRRDLRVYVLLADRDVDLTIVVLDNDGGGIFSFLPQRTQLPGDRFERLFGTPHGLDLVALARAHGVEADRIDTLDALDWKPGVRVLVVDTDRDANVALHRELDDAVAAALSGP